MRDVYDGLQDLLAHTAQKLSEGLEEEFAKMLDVMYFPQLVVSSLSVLMKGYLVTVPIGDDGQPIFMLEDWDMRFSTSEKVFFKCSEIYGISTFNWLIEEELDEYYGDIYSLIIGTISLKCLNIDREVEIIHNLRVKILTYSLQLSAISRVLGELDWYISLPDKLISLLSLASAAQKYNFKRPYVTDENVINIVGGRHPLHQLVVPTFIENDTVIVGGDDAEVNEMKAPSVLLLTGANYSGKSVYLKQVFLPNSLDTRSLLSFIWRILAGSQI